MPNSQKKLSYIRYKREGDTFFLLYLTPFPSVFLPVMRRTCSSSSPLTALTCLRLTPEPVGGASERARACACATYPTCPPHTPSEWLRPNGTTMFKSPAMIVDFFFDSRDECVDLTKLITFLPLSLSLFLSMWPSQCE